MTFTMHCTNIWHKIKEETVHVWNRTEQIDIRICSQISISDNQVCNCVHPTIMLFLDYRITTKQRVCFLLWDSWSDWWGQNLQAELCPYLKFSKLPFQIFPEMFASLLKHYLHSTNLFSLGFCETRCTKMCFTTPLHLTLHRNRADRD